MNKRGRPSKFRNAAEKQKAYRERQKLTEALRNSSGSTLDQPAPVASNLLDLWAVVERASLEHDHWRGILLYGPQFEAIGGFDGWKRGIDNAFHQWERAHAAWGDEWTRQGRPCGPWSNSWKKR
jgi:hypothetical protein